MLSKLYQKFGITERTNFSRMRPEDYPILSDLYDLIEQEFKNYDAGQHQLPVALGGQMRRLMRHFIQRQAADAAARIRDDAVGAEIIAAILNFQHRACAPVGSTCRQRFKVKALERIIHARDGRVLAECAQNVIHERLLAATAMHHIGTDGRRVLRAELRPAAAHGAQRLRVFLAQLADHLA